LVMVFTRTNSALLGWTIAAAVAGAVVVVIFSRLKARARRLD
jgi:hypothetical protein